MNNESLSAPTRVLYIAGTGRSGSTLVANILGQIDGWFSGGEIRYLWDRGLEQDRLCGCGEPFSRCPVWQAVLAGIDGGVDPAAMLHHQRETGRLRQAPLMLAEAGRERLRARMGDYPAHLDALYRSIASVTEARIIVDSSKLPTYAFALDAAPGIDLSVLHLVRDPRAAAYSWSHPKPLTDNAPNARMEVIGPAKSALLWDAWNVATERVWADRQQRYLRMRYEDFVAEPRAAIEQIVAFVGEPHAALPFTDDRTVELAPTHTVAGNPDRLRTGGVAVRADDPTARKLDAGDRRIVDTLTAGVRGHFGYTQPDVTDGEPNGQAPQLVQDASATKRFSARVGRHIHWGRTQGWGRLVEEDQLDPVERATTSLVKWRWRRAHGVAPGLAMPVWVVGVQRSGTNMVMRGLESAPETELHNENDRRAFERFLLRPDPVVKQVIAASRHRYVLFKPLCDSHRTSELLDDVHAETAGRAVWVYRGVDGRARSAVAKFGDVNRRVLTRIAAGDTDGLWQAERLSPETLDLIRAVDIADRTDLEAAALFWYVRNVLFFEQGLDLRSDVTIVSYDMFVADPAATMRPLCGFLEMEFTPALVAHVEARSAGRESPLDLHPAIRAACEDLQSRLDAAAASAAATPA